MQRRGGGAKEVEVRVLPAPEGARGEPLLIVHLLIDTQEAMGANLINTMAEGVAPLIEQITGGRVYLRILSNLADRRLARATCRIPVKALADFDMDGRDIADGIHQASRFAVADPYRAATHNKGVMNGIDAVAIAMWTGLARHRGRSPRLRVPQRPVPSALHWTLEDGHLVGRIELPLALGPVGGTIKIHPGVQLGPEADALLERAGDGAGLRRGGPGAELRRACGRSARWAFRQGHMALHARCVAVTAGARGDHVEKVAHLLVKCRHVKVDKAREILASLGLRASSRFERRAEGERNDRP